MFFPLRNILIFAVLLLIASTALFAQRTADLGGSSRREDTKEETPRSFSEVMAKHRIEQAKKDHDEMIARGDDALQLSDQIETSYEKTGSLTRQDRQKLEELEKVVVRIRKELGGDDEEEATVDEKSPSSLGEAVKYLQTTTAKMVDELKKSTRFTISAAAIQTSNAVIRVARFLRLRK